MIILRGVNVFPSQIEEQLMQVPALAPHFQIELTKPDRMDQMAVTVEPASAADAGDAARQAAASALAGRIKDAIGVTVKVNVVDIGAAPRSQGKAVRVVDNRPK